MSAIGWSDLPPKGPLACIWAAFCEKGAVAYTKCMFLPLKAQNPAILPRRPIHAKIIVKYGGLASGAKEFEAFWALQGALGPLGGQIGPPDGAHMQVKWLLGPSNFVYFLPKAKFDRPDGHFTSI